MIIDLLKEQQYIQYVNYTNDKIIVFKENNSKYKAKNDKRKWVYKLIIDDGIIKDVKVKKCDFGLYIDDRQILILIELKGCDIERAFNQILKTYEWFYKNSGQDDVILKVRIIITHCSHFNIDYARKKLIKLCKWQIDPNDIIVRKEYDDEI